MAEPTIGQAVEQVAALRRELELTWNAHEREHRAHELAHGREHEFAQRAIETAASLAKENKADANEWRATMTDRESRFSTKDDVAAILTRLDKIERAEILSAERERQRIADDAEDKRQSERRANRGQWVIGIIVGAITAAAAILVNLALRLSEQAA